MHQRSVHLSMPALQVERYVCVFVWGAACACASSNYTAQLYGLSGHTISLC